MGRGVFGRRLNMCHFGFGVDGLGSFGSQVLFVGSLARFPSSLYYLAKVSAFLA